MMNTQAPAAPPPAQATAAAFNQASAFNQAAARQSTAPMDAAQTPPGPSAQETAVPNELMPLLQNYGGLVLNALNGQVPGFEFADNLVRLFGGATHASIAN